MQVKKEQKEERTYYVFICGKAFLRLKAFWNIVGETTGQALRAVGAYWTAWRPTERERVKHTNCFLDY